mgnify:CR=1 FL=1
MKKIGNMILLAGKNGSGKTTLFEVIEIFQKIGHGTTYVEKIFDKNSFSYSDLSKSIYIQLEVEITKRIFKYDLTIDYVEKHFTPGFLKRLVKEPLQNS